MKSEGVLETKSFDFSIRIVKLTEHLRTAKSEFIISKQLLRSGTYIGANIAEAQYAQSKADFVSKMHISLKEANETRYWLRLLLATDYLKGPEFDSLILDCNTLINILISTCKTLKNEQQ